MITENLKKELTLSGWYDFMLPFFESKNFETLCNNLRVERSQYKICPESNYYRVFKDLHFKKIKVVIIGQDPYHGPKQANGLAFAVNKGKIFPPSLKNIFVELGSDLSINGHNSKGTLLGWLSQGIMLLNTCLTVRQGEPGSHSDIGWSDFTDFIIKSLSDHKEFVVFVLWGEHAKSKAKLIDRTKHAVIESSHPSPFSASRGFFGSKPFSKINNLLESKGFDKINWSKIDIED